MSAGMASRLVRVCVVEDAGPFLRMRLTVGDTLTLDFDTTRERLAACGTGELGIATFSISRSGVPYGQPTTTADCIQRIIHGLEQLADLQAKKPEALAAIRVIHRELGRIQGMTEGAAVRPAPAGVPVLPSSPSPAPDQSSGEPVPCASACPYCQSSRLAATAAAKVPTGPSEEVKL